MGEPSPATPPTTSKAAGRTRETVLRVLSAVVLLPGVIALVLWDNRWGFGGLSLLAIAIALREFAAMTLRARPIIEHAVVVGAGTGFASALYLRPDLALPSLVGVALILLVAQLPFAKDVGSAGYRLAVSLAAVLYVGLLLVALPLLQRDVEQGESWVLLALAATFSCDTGAYFLGRAIGRHKLAPSISPGKTWEGFAGGVAATLAAVLAARATFFPGLHLLDVAVVGVGVSLLAPAGDLVESLLKRSAGVKDSGHLIPGHGGMLDRVDALMFSGAFLYLYAGFLR